MAIEKMDAFKAAFGRFDDTKVADWRAAAGAAIDRLRGSVAALSACGVSAADSEAVLEGQVEALRSAHDQPAAAACRSCKAIIAAASAAEASVQEALIAASPDLAGVRRILALPDGGAILDRLVEQDGSGALAERAVRARFAVTLDRTGPTTKSAARLYALLGRIPETPDGLRAVMRRKGTTRHRRSTTVLSGAVLRAHRPDVGRDALIRQELGIEPKKAT